MVRHLYSATWKCWTTDRKLGCLISTGNGKSSPFSSFHSISLKYLLSIHPFICSDNRVHGFFVGFAWRFAGRCTIKARIKAKNNYSGLCVSEWQQWKAHCELCTPAAAWAKDLKAEEVDIRGVGHRGEHLLSCCPPWLLPTFLQARMPKSLGSFCQGGNLLGLEWLAATM